MVLSKISPCALWTCLSVISSRLMTKKRSDDDDAVEASPDGDPLDWLGRAAGLAPMGKAGGATE